MRAADSEQSGMFSYISVKRRVPKDHPLRAIRTMVDSALKELRPRLDGLYVRSFRPSIAAERLPRALLLQVLYSVRSERMLMEQLDYNLLFRWFVGLSMDDCIWGGHSHVRRILYMATVAGIRSDPIIRAFYLRLRAKGKPASERSPPACASSWLFSMPCFTTKLIGRHLRSPPPSFFPRPGRSFLTWLLLDLFRYSRRQHKTAYFIGPHNDDPLG